MSEFTTKRLETLREKKARLETELKALTTQTRAEERKRETRRKVLAGAWLFELIERGEFPATEFERGMDVYLTRERDRELFGLRPKSEP